MRAAFPVAAPVRKVEDREVERWRHEKIGEEGVKRPPSSFRFGPAGLFLLAASMTAAQGQEARDGKAAQAAAGWAKTLVGSLLRDSATRESKLALQPLAPAHFEGLNARQRRRLHGQLLQALADEAPGRYDLVDRASLADVSHALEDSPDPRWQDSYLEVLKKAQARINIVCRSTPGAASLAVECNATDLRDGRSLAVSSATFDLAWVNQPIALNLAVGSIARGIASRVGSSRRLSELRIVDGRTGRETRLSKHVANALEQSIDRHVRVDPGAAGQAAFRLDGEVLDTGFGDGLLLSVRLFSGSRRLRLFQEYVAGGSVGLAAGSSPAAGCGTDGEIAKRVLPAGYTLGDWRLLATDRLERRDHVQLVVEAKAHLRDHCGWSGAREVFDLALSGLASGIRLSGKGDARRALARIAEIEGSAGEHPVLLGLRARAHRLLGAYAREEETHRRWLRLVPDTHPERRKTLLALMRARAAVSDGARFAAALGRPFSATAKEESAGWTDLHYAAVLNLPGVVQALVDAGVPADVRLKHDFLLFSDALRDTLVGLGHEEFKYSWAGGQTPLIIAARVNAEEAAAKLVEAGADISAKNKYGQTLLHWAALTNARKAAEWLASQGADIGAKDNAGETPVHGAARGNARETAEWLVGRGADIGAKDNAGETPLHEAAFGNARKTAEWLVGRGADIGAKDNAGETPLHEAAWGNARKTAEWLASQGADIGAKDNAGETPLHEAAFGNARKTAEWLVGQGADIRAKDNYGHTPLHEGATGNARETAEWLVGQGAEINAKDNVRQTPLHWAAWGNARKTAEWLVEHGADINAKNYAGLTPLDEVIASTRGNAKERAATRAMLRRLGGKCSVKC